MSIMIYRQILPQHCFSLKKMGYQTLINLRPEDEQTDQSRHEDLVLATNQAGLSYYYFPVVDIDSITDLELYQLAEKINQLPKPILMVCGSGFRAKYMYQMIRMKGYLQ